MKLLLVALFAIIALSTAKHCFKVPVYKITDVKSCSSKRVGPFTKTIIVKTPYKVSIPYVSKQTYTAKKVVCYNKRVPRTVSEAYKVNKLAKVSVIQRVREYYSFSEAYETTVRSKRWQTYKHYYNKQVKQYYTKRWNEKKTIKTPYTYTSKCKGVVSKTIKVWVNKRYSSTCPFKGTKKKRVVAGRYKNVWYNVKVWTGKWVGGADCQKKVYKTLRRVKKVPHITYKYIRVPHTYRKPCIKTRKVKVSKKIKVPGMVKCKKSGVRTKVITVRRSKYTYRYVSKRTYTYKKRLVSYNKRVIKYRNVRKWRYSYKSKIVSRKVPVYRYRRVVKYITVAAHKTVSYPAIRYVTKYKSKTLTKYEKKTVARKSYKKVCTTKQVKKIDSYKTACNY